MVDWTQEESRGDVDRDDAHRDVIIAKHANKFFWSKVTVRTKKANNHCQAEPTRCPTLGEQHCRSHPRGVQRGLFGRSPPTCGTTMSGDTMALRGWTRPTNKSPPTSRASQRLVMVGNELRSNFWLVPFVD